MRQLVFAGITYVTEQAIWDDATLCTTQYVYCTEVYQRKYLILNTFECLNLLLSPSSLSLQALPCVKVCVMASQCVSDPLTHWPCFSLGHSAASGLDSFWQTPPLQSEHSLTPSSHKHTPHSLHETVASKALTHARVHTCHVCMSSSSFCVSAH